MTEREAARRLGMSLSWFKTVAKVGGIRVERRGRLPGVDWTSVEEWIGRCRLYAEPGGVCF